MSFSDPRDIKEWAKNLKTLNDLEIVNYKITGPTNFSASFTNKFIDYFNTNYARLQMASIQNMVGAIKQFPEDISPRKDIRTEQFSTMFFSTVVLSYLNDTKLIKKLPPNNIDTLAELIVATEELRHMAIEEKERENG